MNNLLRPLPTVLVLLCVAPRPVPAVRGAEDGGQLTIERIYRSGEFHSERFASRWMADGSAYLTLEASRGPGGGHDLVAHDPHSGAASVLVPAKLLTPSRTTTPLPVSDYALSADGARLLVYTNSKRVWRQNTRGDYWVLDRTSHELRQLGGNAPPSSLMFAKFSPSGREVAYVRERNIYVEDLEDGSIEAITRTPSDSVINGTFDWVYEEELGLRDGFRWSPDGRRIAYWQLDTSGVRQIPLVNNTDSLYPQIQWIKYPKTGETNSACRAGAVDVDTGETRWIELPGDSRDHYIARMEWAANSEELVIQQLNRLQNTNRVFLADARTGKARVMLVERDDAWVEIGDALRWIEGGQRFTWLSERDGWRHAYVAPRAGGEARLVTPGEYDVIDVLGVDAGAEWLYFSASPENPTQQYLYRAKLDGTAQERLTPPGEDGTHRYDLSPGARWAIHRHSRFDTPTITDVVRLPVHERVRTLRDSSRLKERLGRLARQPAEFFRVDIGEGVELDAWCLKPPDLDPERKYPLLVYVYGEPAGQTVLDRWGGTGYLWHLLFAQRGYVVVSIDNRGTPAPRGRAWRKSVYRQVGILAPKDQAAAVRAVLSERPYLDAARVGVWGWSGGGSMSLNALFKYPDLYHTAVSIAPVPNQRLYDTIYQERYMGLPHDNVEGYWSGSPVNFAHRLEGNLLVIHGTGDDNCHYQGTEMLINELVRHGKTFTMMAYPNRSHGIHEGVNTSIHLRELVASFILEHLPPGPRRES